MVPLSWPLSRRLPWLLASLVAVAWLAGSPALAAAQGSSVLVTRVEGNITPVIADHLVAGVDKAEREGHAAYLVEIDTPGGLVTSMRKIVGRFLGAEVPVIVYVTPTGARAASAGTFITLAGNVAAMAPGTTIGAATPVTGGSGEEASEKVVNDMAAYAESVANQRDRNVEFAENAVREGTAITSEEAAEIGAIDLIADDRAALLGQIDGQQVTLGSGADVTLRTAGADVEEYDLGLFRQVLQILADPNLAFLFISLGSLAILYELANPGMGFGGVAGAILLVLGFFSLSVLPVNVAGIALLVLSMALFAAEVFTPGVGVFAGGGAVTLVFAGIFLFEGSVGVSPAVLWPTVIVVGGGSLLAGRLAWRARRAPSVSGGDVLIGRQAVVRNVDPDGRAGTVLLEGAWWSVTPRVGPLRAGQPVRVIEREDLHLIVEPTEDQS